MDKDGVLLALDDPTKDSLLFPYNCGNNIPYMIPKSLGDECQSASLQAGWTVDDFFRLQDEDVVLTSICSETNQNLTSEQKTALLWHQRLGHAGWKWILGLMVTRSLSPNSDLTLAPAIIANIKKPQQLTPPKCAACQVSKQKQVSTGSRVTSNVPSQELRIRRDDLQPGDCVSIDNYVSAVPGRLPNSRGLEADHKKFRGGTIIVDHASGFIFVRNQTTLNAGDALMSKELFEEYADSFGVMIKRYRADNNPFQAKDFLANIEAKQQQIDFSAANAHHQNGCVERNLQTVSSWARAMMLHSFAHWPSVADPALWPFAMEHAAFLWNHMPNPGSGLAPIELFTGSRLPHHDSLQKSRVWGCPAFVLDPKLADGHKIPKWKPRSRLGMYLGKSSAHGNNVGLILNIETGYISPQFHVVYDEFFTTVPTSIDLDQFDQATWDSLIATGLEQVPHDDVDEATGRYPFQDFFDTFIDNCFIFI